MEALADDRLYNRTFNNSKIESIRGKYDYKPCFESFGECLDEFQEHPKWLEINTRYEVWCDQQAGDFIPLVEIPGYFNKLRYLKGRFMG